MRHAHCACGVAALLLGALTLWVNVSGGFARAAWLCDAGFCEAEPVERAIAAAALAGPIRPDDPAARLRQTLLRGDSASPFTWSKAAVEYDKAGDRARAEYCAARAFQLGRGSAPLLMRVLHFHLAGNSREDVLRTGKELLALVRDFDDFVFRYYDETGSSTADVLDRGLPSVAGAATSYLNNRMAAGGASAATATWTWMKARSLVSEDALNAYVGFLIRRKEIDASRRTWDEFHAAERAPYPGNLVYNPEFELPLSKGPYDWRVSQIAGANTAVERSAREGKPALRIDFLGEENVQYQHASQAVAITGRPLRLRVWVKAADLTTNEGVAIRVADQEAPGRFQLTTEGITGTSGWKQWDYRLDVPPQTRLLDLRVVRQRSQKFDNKIKGTVWLSGFSIEPGAR